MLLPEDVVVLARPNPATAPLASTFTVYCPSKVPSALALAVNCCSTVTPVPPALSNLAVKPFTVLDAALADPAALVSDVAAFEAKVDASPAVVVAVFA